MSAEMESTNLPNALSPHCSLTYRIEHTSVLLLEILQEFTQYTFSAHITLHS